MFPSVVAVPAAVVTSEAMGMELDSVEVPKGVML
jgi:hypothetical protein